MDYAIDAFNDECFAKESRRWMFQRSYKSQKKAKKQRRQKVIILEYPEILGVIAARMDKGISMNPPI